SPRDGHHETHEGRKRQRLMQIVTDHQDGNWPVARVRVFHAHKVQLRSSRNSNTQKADDEFPSSVAKLPGSPRDQASQKKSRKESTCNVRPHPALQSSKTCEGDGNPHSSASPDAVPTTPKPDH